MTQATTVRYFTTTGGVLEWRGTGTGAELPAGVIGEVSAEEYHQRLAQWETERAQRRQQVRDAERAQATQDVAALVQAGIDEAVARRMAKHPDAQYAGATVPDGGGR